MFSKDVVSLWTALLKLLLSEAFLSHVTGSISVLSEVIFSLPFNRRCEAPHALLPDAISERGFVRVIELLVFGKGAGNRSRWWNIKVSSFIWWNVCRCLFGIVFMSHMHAGVSRLQQFGRLWARWFALAQHCWRHFWIASHILCLRLSFDYKCLFRRCIWC